MLIEREIYINTADIWNLNKIVVTQWYKVYLIAASEQSEHELPLNNVHCFAMTILSSRHKPKNEQYLLNIDSRCNSSAFIFQYRCVDRLL
jgi:hypothetical protein